jgi:hypothetical protein
MLCFRLCEVPNIIAHKKMCKILEKFMFFRKIVPYYYAHISQLSTVLLMMEMSTRGAFLVGLQHQAIELRGAVPNQLLQITDKFVHKPLPVHLKFKGKVSEFFFF